MSPGRIFGWLSKVPATPGVPPDPRAEFDSPDDETPAAATAETAGVPGATIAGFITLIGPLTPPLFNEPTIF